eukprot:1304068-Alexandrium_andersonii.AAC.1
MAGEALPPWTGHGRAAGNSKLPSSGPAAPHRERTASPTSCSTAALSSWCSCWDRPSMPPPSGTRH